MKTAIVLGARRTGTSMLAGVLHKLGVDMGENPERSSERNPAGFFEDEGIVDISRRIIQRAGEEVSMAQLEREFGTEIREAIKSREKDVWGFKDVNQVQTHMLFRKKLKNPVYFVIFRNPLSAAQSLSNWHGVDLLKALQQTLQDFQMLQNYAQVTLAGDPVMMLSYEKMLEQPERTVEDVANFLELPHTNKKEAIEHVKPKLKNQ